MIKLERMERIDHVARTGPKVNEYNIMERARRKETTTKTVIDGRILKWI
jgi:hypothetical protein